MKCTRCGKEMTIKPVQSGTDESGEPVFTRYAFCYDCKIKVNLDKQKERDTQKKATAEDVVETKTKRKKREGKSFLLFRFRKDEAEEERRKRGKKDEAADCQVLTLSDRCCGTWICSIYLSASNCKIRTADV